QAVILTDGNLSKAIRASTSVPTLFQPLAYRDLLLADGGLSDSVPVDVVRSMGADIVIAVNLDTLSTKKGMLPTLDKIPLQSINILRHNLALQSTKTAEVIISPSGIPQIGLVGWEYFFDLKKNKDLIEAGEKAGEEGISQILESMKKSTKRKKTFFQKMISFFHKKG
ncbi:MAG TPA: patatin-like phospholipase family protein, partial [Patescibacteria group bacterium]|nr:patatin-like phospholipase family protein [Patescibacteria group bacterium]